MSTYYTGVTNFQKTVRFWPTLYIVLEGVLLISIATSTKNVSAIPQATVLLKSIANTHGDTVKMLPIVAIPILVLRYKQQPMEILYTSVISFISHINVL